MYYSNYTVWMKTKRRAQWHIIQRIERSGSGKTTQLVTHDDDDDDVMMMVLILTAQRVYGLVHGRHVLCGRANRLEIRLLEL